MTMSTNELEEEIINIKRRLEYLEQQANPPNTTITLPLEPVLKTCYKCGGKGRIRSSCSTSMFEPCYICNGTGKVLT
jgi:DnaJ-class molecular chaperone